MGQLCGGLTLVGCRAVLSVITTFIHHSEVIEREDFQTLLSADNRRNRLPRVFK